MTQLSPTPYIGDTITVDAEYVDGNKRAIELVITADRVMDGRGEWYPGVDVLDTSDFDAETIAYGINEGRVVEARYPDWVDQDELIAWRVREPDAAKLRELYIADRRAKNDVPGYRRTQSLSVH